MPVSVIVPVKADPRLARLLDALAGQTLPADRFEVVVVDNGPDAAVRSIAGQFAACYVEHPDGGSYAARARGAAEAAGDLLVFTDADCIPPPGWLAAIAALFADPDCVVATGPSSGTRGSTVAAWAHAIDDARWRALSKTDRVAFCDTRNLAIRRELLAAVPFDPAFRQAGDIDLGIRLYARGVTIRLAPEMRLAHDDPRSLLVLLRRGVRRGRGLAQLARKHGSYLAPTGQRPLRVGGRDVKDAVLRWTQVPPIRVAAVAVAALGLAALVVALFVLALVPGGERRGRRLFVVFERLSLLLGRLLGPAANR